MSYAAFKTIFRIKADFGIVLRVIGGFLNVAKSSSRRVTEVKNLSVLLTLKKTSGTQTQYLAKV
jgi:hypothetical protein